MEFIYDEQDALTWANFSGDFNPIHFDLDKALSMGMSALTVHGMRALLDLKNVLSESVASQYAGDYHFVARLRQPVKCRTRCRITLGLHSQMAHVSGQLSEVATEQVCFSGRLAPAKLPLTEHAVLNQQISEEQILAWYRLLPGAQQKRALWVFLDALLFQRIVHASDTVDYLKKVMPGLQVSSLADVFQCIPIVQTHHEVHFGSELLTLCGETLPAGPLLYGFLPPLILGDSKQGYIIRMAAEGEYGSGRRITTTITLKAW